ncbi:MAG: DUF4416 family protein [Deltaproteobacteria bacterium]|nr:DUF4416 family protein [Deltaproteobacteria bacterium]
MVQYFFAVIHGEGRGSQGVADIVRILADAFGPLEEFTETFPFDRTDYYADEMGGNLCRTFFALKKLGMDHELARFKEGAVQMEKAFFSSGGKRSANIDPGYLDQVKVVLASTKHGGHKVALTDRICADLVLDYYKGAFRPFEWTFPDFRSGVYFPLLEKIRRLYLEKSR